MSERWSEIDDMELRQMEAEMGGELADFRTAATVYAERSRERGGQALALNARVAARPAAGLFRWAGAAVAALALTVGGVRVLHHTATVPGGTAAAVTPTHQVDAVSDEALLNQIQSDLSTGVPAAMQPLDANGSSGSARNNSQRTE